MQVKVLQNAPRRAFCNTFDLHNKLPFVIKIFALSIFKWPFYTGYALCVCGNLPYQHSDSVDYNLFQSKARITHSYDDNMQSVFDHFCF